MLYGPTRHIQQFPNLSVTHIHEVGQQDHISFLPQEGSQCRRKTVIIDRDAVSTHFKYHGMNILIAQFFKKLRRKL